MTIQEYEDLPDSLSLSAVHDYTVKVLEESEGETTQDTLEKLIALGERQWHTYEYQPEALRVRLANWLIQRWTDNSYIFIESLVAVAYCYALAKDLVEKALENYNGEHRTEFRHDYENSKGPYMDPWWSMKQETPN